ncbi:MAG: hypothetical protein LBO81_03535 [Clostridiales Family XIII bacterium]|jgi:hypothetical protein|nr:hypothetical protein [Clostridiales Family XIII bacterium]
MTPGKLKEKLGRFKIPESEYSLSGKQPRHCLCLEQSEVGWAVFRCTDAGDAKNLGTFFHEYDANDYLFYLLMKKHYDIEKRWW